MKALHELGLERRETVRSLCTDSISKEKGFASSTRGPSKIDPWFSNCFAQSIVASLHLEWINTESINV